MGSRVENSTRNLIYALLGQGLSVLLSFISRSVFVQTLDAPYLGINGLFSNVLTILNLAELGISSAITFSLYEPLLNNDKCTIASIMGLYKRIYRIVGIVVLSAGLFLSPFIQYFITSETEISYVEWYFILYVVNTGVSYFFSYKRTLIAANQTQYINTIYQYTALIVQNILQIILLYTTHNFTIFLLIQIGTTIGQNIAISHKADKLYPYLKTEKVSIPNIKIINSIKKNVGAMFLHKVGSAVVNSTDNILISKLVNITAAGIYSNYYLVIGALNQLIGQFFSAITASVGNLGAEKDKLTLKVAFERVLFLNFWMYAFSTICCACLFQPFIELWVGSQLLLEANILFVILINFYLNGMRKTVLTFREAMGLYWYDRYKPIFESIINLIASIVLALRFGFVGIFIGTTISCLTTSFWVEPYVLCKYGFKNTYLTIGLYFKQIATYSCLMVGDLLICLYITGKVKIGGITGFIIQSVIAILLSNLILIIFLGKTKYFKWYMDVLFRLIKRIIG